MDNLLRAVLCAGSTALVLLMPAAAVDVADPDRSSRSALGRADGIVVTSVCTTTLAVQTTEDHPRFDYRVVSGPVVLVPVSWVGDGLIQSRHYLPSWVRRHQTLTVVGSNGVTITVSASPRKCP